MLVLDANILIRAVLGSRVLSLLRRRAIECQRRREHRPVVLIAWINALAGD